MRSIAVTAVLLYRLRDLYKHERRTDVAAPPEPHASMIVRMPQGPVSRVPRVREKPQAERGAKCVPSGVLITWMIRASVDQPVGGDGGCDCGRN